MTSNVTLFYGTVTADASLILHGGIDNINLAMNEKTGAFWTPTSSPGQTILAGGPPFAMGGIANSLKFRGFDAVTEQVPIRISGASDDAIMDTLSTLRKALYSTSLRSPAVLSFSPDNLTNNTYYLILHGDVQESPAFINEENGRKVLRAVITWIRGATGLDTTADVLQNAQTITNNANSSPPNYKVMSGIKGDYIYAGQPLIWSITPAASGMFKGAGVQRCYAATLYEAPTYINTNDAISAAGGGATTTIATENVQIALSDPAFGVKHRVVSRITSPTSNLEVRIQVVFGNGTFGTGATIYTSKWIAPGTSTTLIDFGRFTLPFDAIALEASLSCRILTQARSTNGSTATGTWADVEILDYLTFCRITSTVSLTDVALLVTGAAGYSALPVGAVTPYAQPQVQFRSATTTGIVVDYPEVIGSLPTGINGAYWWGVTLTAGVHDSTDTGTLTISSARLWSTMRGT